MSSNKEILDRLENGVKEIFKIKNYKEFLSFYCNKMDYSINNLILIYMQNNKATNIKGYKSWIKLGRNVKKGEKGIKIIVPFKFKYENTEGKEEELLRFKVTTVFDISQTEGKEIPNLVEELKGSSEKSVYLYNVLKMVCDIEIKEALIEYNGFYSFIDNYICIRENMEDNQKLKTLVHEYAHYSMKHNADYDRRTAEVEAESVAYVVLNHFGIDTSQFSFGYIASWSEDKEVKELKSSLNKISNVSKDIIKNIESEIENMKLLNKSKKSSFVKIHWSDTNKFNTGEIIKIKDFNRQIKDFKNEESEKIKYSIYYKGNETIFIDNINKISKNSLLKKACKDNIKCIER